MKKIEENVYGADHGNVIYRKADNFTMGVFICLGEEDSIDNYAERNATDEEAKEWYGEDAYEDEVKPAREK